MIVQWIIISFFGNIISMCFQFAWVLTPKALDYSTSFRQWVRLFAPTPGFAGSGVWRQNDDSCKTPKSIHKQSHCQFATGLKVTHLLVKPVVTCEVSFPVAITISFPAAPFRRSRQMATNFSSKLINLPNMKKHEFVYSVLSYQTQNF